LPEWVSKTIASIAYERGHSAGNQEVAMIEESMIADFEAAFHLREDKESSGTTVIIGTNAGNIVNNNTFS
jgi:actin-like ATPase involved in cell morphogenesis